MPTAKATEMAADNTKSSPQKAGSSSALTSINDLNDEELRLVFKAADALDAFDLINAGLVCKRWHVLSKANDTWTGILTPPAYKDEDIDTLRAKSPTALKDWWCLQHWLQAQFWKEYTRRRNEQKAKAAAAAAST